MSHASGHVGHAVTVTGHGKGLVSRVLTRDELRLSHQHEEPSNYISLTFNVLYVLWMWKWQISSFPQSEGCQDDFRIIALNSSKLCASRWAKLGTQLLSRETEKQKDTYRFAQSYEEVIVAKYIESEAILGSMLMSELKAFIPTWCQKLQWVKKPSQCFDVLKRLAYQKINKLDNNLKIIYVLE